MQKWQESRNYKRIKDENSEVLAYIITVDGRDIEVAEEVYQAYSQADRRERYVREEVEPGKVLSEDEVSLEKLGVEMSPSAEETMLGQEGIRQTEQQLKRLADALASLNTAERQLLQALYFDRLSAREYARQLGVYHRTILYRRDKLLEKLRGKICA